MIYLTRLNGNRFVLNAEMVREIESTPDTIVTLASGEKSMVQEAVDAVVTAVINYKRVIMGGPYRPEGESS